MIRRLSSWTITFVYWKYSWLLIVRASGTVLQEGFHNANRLTSNEFFVGSFLFSVIILLSLPGSTFYLSPFRDSLSIGSCIIS